MAKAEKSPVNFREFERNNEDVKKAEHLKLPLSRIKRKKGFNPRCLDKPSTQEKIAAMVDSYVNKRHVDPLLVRMAPDGHHVHVVDGDCRFTAAERADKILRDKGVADGIGLIEVMRFNGTEREAKVQTLRSNGGENLTPIEQADLLVWLRDEEGLSREEIAAEFQKSIGWIDRLIVIAKLPEEVKQIVREDKIAAETAVKFVKEHGEEGAAQAIMATLKGATENGESKVTPKHTKEKGKASADTSPAAIKKERLETAKDVAFLLPEKLTRVKTIKDDVEYEIKVPGATLKALMKLQDLYEAEIAEAAEKE